MINKSLQVYDDIANFNLQGADFEKRWMESVVTVLLKIQTLRIQPARARELLLEICWGFDWISVNLNPQLSAEHRRLLSKIYGLNIQIIHGYLENNNVEYLDIVIKSLHVIMEPYGKY